MPAFSYGETVVLVRRVRSGRDVYGDDVFTESETTLTGVPAWPTSSREDVQGADTIFDLVTVYLPAGTDVESIDAVLVYGGRYEVVGQPQPFVSPFSGFNPGLPVSLERVTG